MAYDNGAVSLHAKIKVRIPGLGLVETTVGRVIFNEIIPEELKKMEWDGFYNEVIG